MLISELINTLGAEIILGEDKLSEEVNSACGSDMMSDVLAFVKDQAVLLTGLVNTQVVRTCQMMDIKCIVFVRGKLPGEDLLALAKQNQIVVVCSKLRLYEACGLLYMAGLKGGDHIE